MHQRLRPAIRLAGLACCALFVACTGGSSGDPTALARPGGPDAHVLPAASRGPVVESSPDAGDSARSADATLPGGVSSPGAVFLPPVARFMPIQDACAGKPVTFDARESFDQDGIGPATDGIASYAWDFGDGVRRIETGPLVEHVFDEPGTYLVALLVTDDDPPAVQQTDVHVLSFVVAPGGCAALGPGLECDAGGPYFAESQGDTTPIQLDGTGSTGEVVSWMWSTDCPGGVFDDPTSPTPILTVDSSTVRVECTVHLMVGDGKNLSPCETQVTVGPQGPPPVSVSCEPALLWPPNHVLVPIAIDVCVGDCVRSAGAPPDVTVEIWSDEAELATGSGNHAPDAKDLGDCVALRRERQGPEDGRVYLVVVQTTDEPPGYGYCAVVVPKAQSTAWIDSVLGQAYELVGYFRENPGTPPEDLGLVRQGLAPEVGPHQTPDAPCAR